MICPPQPRDPMIEDWIERHRHPVSFALHMVGIPSTILGGLIVPIGVATWSGGVFVAAVALFVGGYLVQFLGHALDGSEPGEVTFFRRKLASRRRYVEAAPAPRPSHQGAA